MGVQCYGATDHTFFCQGSLVICILVLQTSLKIFLSVNFDQFLGLDGPYLALLGPLLASLASGLTPLTCGNPVSTQSKQSFDDFLFFFGGLFTS